MLKSQLKIALTVIFLTLAVSLPCRAQYRIPMDSVAKITFMHIAPFWNNQDYRKIEVVKEGGLWKAYRTELHIEGFMRAPIDSFNRVFLKDIAKSEVKDFFKAIAQSDTGINPSLFKIDKRLIMNQVDSLLPAGGRVGPLLRPRQRAAFIKVINSKKKLDSMITEVIRRSLASQSDINSYPIEITTKGGKKYQVTGYASSMVYGHFPWTIGKVKSYDPRISYFFNLVMDTENDYFQQKGFYNGIAFWTYMKYFRNRISLENLHDDFPLAYNSLTSTFTVVSMIADYGYKRKTPMPQNELKYNGVFHSGRLPKYVDLRFEFTASDTASLSERKRFLDTIVQHFNSKLSLFNQLLSQPDATIFIRQGSMAKYGKEIFESFKTNFPGLMSYDYKKSQLIRVRGGKYNTLSHWILLPDNTVLLCEYLPDDKKLLPKEVHFMGLDDELMRKHYLHSYGVCLHLDALGKLIHDYGEVAEPYFGPDNF